jgi:hypothetical protein
MIIMRKIWNTGMRACCMCSCEGFHKAPLIYWFAQSWNNPHQSQGLRLTHVLHFYIPALPHRPITGWATLTILGFTCSRLCNRHSFELLVLCMLVYLESVTDSRPPKAMPLIRALRSCSHVLSTVYLRLPKSHRPRSHSQTHIGVFLQVYPVGQYLVFTDLRIH